MSVVHPIARTHGGDAVYRADQGRTVFTIAFPRQYPAGSAEGACPTGRRPITAVWTITGIADSVAAKVTLFYPTRRRETGCG